jgi:hypothetical protein
VYDYSPFNGIVSWEFDVLKNNSDRDLLIDKYTLLEKMFLKHTFLEKFFFNYNPKSCCYPF